MGSPRSYPRAPTHPRTGSADAGARGATHLLTIGAIGINHVLATAVHGAAAGFGRLASIAAPLCVPPLLDAGGTGLVFGTFAAFFVLGGLATFWLPERRGRSLEDDAGTPGPVAGAD